MRFTFDGAGDREIPLILGLLPVLPKHLVNPDTYEATSLEPPVGSGPYVVAKIDAGRSITYRRDPNYWGKDLPVNRGRFNFEEIRFDYFRESSVMFEAFKTGQVGVWPEEDPRRWANGYDFPAVTDGRVVKGTFDIGLPAGMTGARVQHAPRRVRGPARAPRADPAVRLRVDQPHALCRAVQAHAELLRALDPRLRRAAGRCTRAGAARSLRRAR